MCSLDFTIFTLPDHFCKQLFLFRFHLLYFSFLTPISSCYHHCRSYQYSPYFKTLWPVLEALSPLRFSLLAWSGTSAIGTKIVPSQKVLRILAPLAQESQVLGFCSPSYQHVVGHVNSSTVCRKDTIFFRYEKALLGKVLPVLFLPVTSFLNAQGIWGKKNKLIMLVHREFCNMLIHLQIPF